MLARTKKAAEALAVCLKQRRQPEGGTFLMIHFLAFKCQAFLIPAGEQTEVLFG